MKALSPARLPWQPCERCGGLGVDAAPDGPTLVRAFCDRWLTVAGQASQPGQPVVLCTAAMPEAWETEFAVFVGEIHVLALICDEEELLGRLGARVRARDDQAPADFLEQTRTFNRVLRERLEHVDTSALDPDEVAERVAAWIRERL